MYGGCADWEGSYAFGSFVKGRWIGREVLEVCVFARPTFVLAFEKRLTCAWCRYKEWVKDMSPEYYVRSRSLPVEVEKC